WHPQPIGPMRQLVFDFVERFLQQKEIEKAVGSLRRPRPKAEVGEGTAITRQKRRYCRGAPTFERAGYLVLVIGRGSERTLERAGCGIVNGADQAGDVARRRRFLSAILDAAPGLAFKIDDEDIILDDQHLTEMKIAVVTDLHGIQGVRQQFVQQGRKRLAGREHSLQELAEIG